MTTKRKLKANRLNALASTGPRSVKGKARASQNARRHGLSAATQTGPIHLAKIESLAHQIAGEGASPEIKARARGIAESQIALYHIRTVRQAYLTEGLRPNDSDKPPDKLKSVRRLSDLTKMLLAIDRYERRALSRRKFAIRELDALARQST